MRSMHQLVAALAAAFFGQSLSAQTQCGLNSVRGNWSYSAVGWAIPLQPADAAPAPYIMVGVMVVDDTGKISGPGTGILGGTVMEFEMDGKIEVNSGCAALMTYGIVVPTPAGPFRLPGDAVARLVVNPRADEIAAYTQVAPPSWGVKPNWITAMKRISPVPAKVVWPAIP